jgi:hypothetical protein
LHSFQFESACPLESLSPVPPPIHILSSYAIQESIDLPRTLTNQPLLPPIRFEFFFPRNESLPLVPGAFLIQSLKREERQENEEREEDLKKISFAFFALFAFFAFQALNS